MASVPPNRTPSRLDNLLKSCAPSTESDTSNPLTVEEGNSIPSSPTRQLIGCPAVLSLPHFIQRMDGSMLGSPLNHLTSSCLRSWPSRWATTARHPATAHLGSKLQLTVRTMPASDHRQPVLLDNPGPPKPGIPASLRSSRKAAARTLAPECFTKALGCTTVDRARRR